MQVKAKKNRKNKSSSPGNVLIFNFWRFFKTSLFFYGFFIFIIVAGLIFILTSLFLPARSIDVSLVIKTVKTKQIFTVVVGEPVKWVALIKRNDINSGQYLVRLPKESNNIKVSLIKKERADEILSAGLQEANSSSYKNKFVLNNKKESLFFENVSFLFADLEQGMDDFVRSALGLATQADEPNIARTSDSTIVDLSPQVISDIEEQMPSLEMPIETLIGETVTPNASEILISDVDVAPAPAPETQDSSENEYVKIDYETPSPEIIEQTTDTGKLVTISSANTEEANCEYLNPVKENNTLSSIIKKSTASLFDAILNAFSSIKKFFTADLEEAVSNAIEAIAEPAEPVPAPEPEPEPAIEPEPEPEVVAPVEETDPAEDLDASAVAEEVPVPEEETPAEAPVDQFETLDETPSVAETPTISLQEQAYQDCLAQQTPITDVLAFTNIPEIYKVGQESRIKIKWKSNNDQTMEFHAYDKDGNGKLDYVEWTVPHLSEQIFEIIFISKAFHLDSDKNIIADIYDQVYEQDSVWASVENNQYIRVTFEKILDNTKDNTIYARPKNSGDFVVIEVYPVYEDADGNLTEGEKIATFENIDHEDMYKVLLTELQNPTDIFDLKVIGSVEIDFIVDPPANAYWVGGAGGWSDATNHWATSSGGTPDAGNTPGTTTICHFDSNSGSADVGIDGSISVSGIAMSSGYTGTITQGSGYTITIGAGDFVQADGIFIGGDSDITINDDFNLSAAGTFNSTSGNLTFTSWGGLFTISGGTFNDGSGTFKITELTTINVNITETFNNFTVDSTADGGGRGPDITAGDTLVVNGTTSLKNGGLVNLGGILNAKGPISVEATFDGSSYGYSGGTLLIDGAGDQSFTVPNGAKLPATTLNNSSTEIDFDVDATSIVYGAFTLQAGTFTCSSGTTQFSNNLTVSGGTFNPNGGTFETIGIAHRTWDIQTSPAVLVLNNFKTSNTAGVITISTGDTIQVDGTTTFIYGFLGGAGTLNAKGPISIAATFTGAQYSYSGATFLIDGAGDQSFVIPNGATMPTTTLNNALTTITAADGATITMEDDFTLQAGTFTCSNGTTTFTDEFTVSGGTFNHNSGTVVLNSNTRAITGNVTFNNLTFASAITNTVANSNTLTVLGTLTLTDGYINQTTIPAGGTIEARGNVTVGSLSDGGTGILTFLVTGDQTITTNGGIMPNVVINKSSGTVSVATGTSANLTTANFTLSSGTFTSTSGLLNVNGNFTNTDGGTFNHNNGTVVIGHYPTAVIDVNNTETFYNLKTTGFAQNTCNTTISSGDTLVVLGTYTMSGYNAANKGTINTGTIEARGNVVIDGFTRGGDATISFLVAGDQTITSSSGWTGNLNINKPSGTVSVTGDLQIRSFALSSTSTFTSTSGTLTTYYNFTNNTGGTFNHNNGTVVLSSTVGQTTIDVATTETFYNLTTKGYGSSAITIPSGDTLVVLGTFTMSGYNTSNKGVLNTGIIEARGNVIVDSLAAGGTATLVFGGSGTQTFDLTGATALFNGDIKVNKSGGQVNLASTLTMDAASQDLIIEEGTFDINNNTLAVSGAGSTFIVQDGGNLQLQGGETVTTPTLQSGSTVTYDGTGSTLKDWTYHHLTINGSGTSVFGVNETLGGNFLLTAGVADFNGKAITTGGDFTIGTGGQILTDTDAMDGAVITVGGNCDLDGESGDQLNFKWTGAGAGAWTMAVTGNIDMDYVTFTPASTNTALLQVHGAVATASNTVTAYSDASGAGHTEIDADDGTNTNSGNNTNWNFGSVNSLPVASSVSIDSSATDIILTEGTTKNVVCAGTVTDDDGYEDITSVTAKLYRTGVGAGAGDDNANHYTLTGDANCIPSGGSVNTETYTCTFAVYFYADPTDDGSPDSADDWTCQMTPTDTVGAGTADTDTIEMDSLTALSVTSTINYSSLALGADTGSTDQTTVVTNTGNRTMDSQVDGYGSGDGDGYSMVCTIGAATIGNEKYSLLASTAYASKTALTDTAFQLTSFNLAKGASSTKNIYWGMGVPASGVGTSCTGKVVFTAVNH